MTAARRQSALIKTKIFIEKRLKIRQNDWQPLIYLMLMFFVLMIAINTADVSTQTMLSQRVGTDAIPQMFFINAFLLAFISIFLSAFVDRINKLKLLQYTLIIIACIVLLARILIYFSPGHNEALSPLWQWLYKMLFIATYATKSIFFLEFWLVAGEVCDTRTAKRIYGIIGAGGMVGAIFSFFVVSGWLAKAINTENLYWIWFAALLGNFIILHKMEQSGLGRKAIFRKTITVKERIQEVSEGFAIVKSSTLLQLLAVVVIFYFSLSYTLDFEFLRTIRANFSEDAMASFIGIVKGLTFTAALLFQIFLTNRIIGKFGVHNSMLLEPSSYTVWFSLITLSLFLGISIFIPVIIAAAFRDLIYFAVHSPSYQIMYNPVSQKERGRARFFIEGLGTPTAQLIAAGLTWILKAATSGLKPFFMILPLGMSLIFIFASLRLKKGFVDALVKDLGREELDIGLGEAKSAIEGKASMDALFQTLTDSNTELAQTAANLIAEQGDFKQVARLFVSLKNVNSIEVQVAIIKAIGRLAGDHPLPELASLIDDDTKEIQLAALNALGSLKDKLATDKVKTLMTSTKDSSIKARCAAVLWHLESSQGMDILKDMLKADSAEMRTAAAEALSEIENEEIADDLLQSMDDRVPKVRYYSALALGRLQYIPAAMRLVQALGDPSQGVRLASQKALLYFPEDIVDILIPKLREKNLDADLQMRIVDILGQLPGQRGETELVELLISDDTIPKKFVLHALSKQEDLANTQKLEQFILKQISSIYRNLSYITILEPHTDKKAGEMLRTLLFEDIVSKKYQIMQALGIINHEPTTFDLIARKLRSPDSYIRANAIETLENIGHRELVHHIIPLVETPNNENLLEKLKKISRALGTNYQTVLGDLIKSKSSLIRACTVFLIAEFKESSFIRRFINPLNKLNMWDPDPLVKENARYAISGMFKKASSNGQLTQLEMIFLLKKVKMFAGMEGEDLKLISEFCTEKSFEPDEAIMKENEKVKNPNLYILISGTVEMSVKFYNSETKTEEKKFLGFLSSKKQDYFGDLEVFGERTAAATYTTIMLPARVLVIDGRKLIHHLAKYPHVALQIARVLSEKLSGRSKLLASGY